MTFFNFYIDPAVGADINAGNTIGAAQVTTTNGNWNQATGVFIAASGTPFAATVVGDYASVYLDGSGNTSFVGKVTAVTSSVNITVDVTTLKYGTSPTTGATGRSCTINGTWASEIVPSTAGWGAIFVPQSTRFNVKGTLSFAASRTFTNTGTDDGSKTVWYSGYNTTPGDLDNDTTNALAKPTWSFGANRLLVGANDNIWSSFNFTCNGNFDMVRSNASTNCRFIRCRMTNTNAGTSTQCIQNNTGILYLDYCYLKTPTTATAVALIDSLSGNLHCVGTVFDSGGFASIQHNTTVGTYFECQFINYTGIGISATTGQIKAYSCTFNGSSGTDGIKWANNIPTGGCAVVSCLFMNLTNGINNASGVTNQGVFCTIECNDYFNVTNHEVGFNDLPEFFGQTESSNPISGTDMTPIAGSNALNNGFPGIVENEAYSSFVAIGAVQPRSGSSTVFGGSPFGIF